MTDRVDPATRSATMSRIRGKNTQPEMIVRRTAHAMGLRFRLHRRDLPGKPDIVLSKHRLIIFVHGCFWHRHAGCSNCTTPKTRMEFWMKKFTDNVERDRRVQVELRRLGWRVAVIWECETKDIRSLRNRLRELTI